jgi:Flp pilus assembly protein TadD
MYRSKFKAPSKSHLLASMAILAAFMTAGCQTTRTAETTGSIAAPSASRTEAEWRRDVDAWGERYRKDPKSAEAAVNYAQALRSTGQREQAVAVLEQSSIYNQNDTAVLGAYGRALADAGNYGQALDVLSRAHTPDQPDWRILSAQGAVLDQMGKHEDARRYYMSALKIVPDEPAVMSNLGLSYALSRKLPEAEETLRRANAYSSREPRVRQNLALVVGLQGRFQEAEDIVRADLSPDEAAASISDLRHMLAAEKTAKKGKPSQRVLQQQAAAKSDS